MARSPTCQLCGRGHVPCLSFLLWKTFRKGRGELGHVKPQSNAIVNTQVRDEKVTVMMTLMFRFMGLTDT